MESTMSTMAERGREVGDNVQEVAGNIKSAVETSLKEQPMTTLAGAAVIGFVMGDDLSPAVWIGVVVATAGLFLLSWPKGARFGKGDWSAAGFGFTSGALFALSANAFRAASLESAPGAPWLGAAVTLVVVQGMQAGVLSAWLAWRDRPALMAGLKAWRRSIGAGFTGFAASALWFTAFGMAPAAAVNAVGVSEIPIASWAGRRLFQEKLTLRQILAASLTGAGVVACALGSLPSGGGTVAQP